jgi:DNA-binding NarL/FixJ family response regulator
VTPPPAPIRIVIADDHLVVRTGFAALLATQPDFEVVGTAADGEETVRLCREVDPDVVLMDVRMPGTDGIEATRRVVTEAGARGAEGPRILILTTFDLDSYVYDALSAGASGFLLKDATAERLFEAVRVVAAGEALLAPGVTRRLISEFARLRPGAGGPVAKEPVSAPAAPVAKEPVSAPAAPGRGLAALTPRETEVLLLLARGLSNPEIAAELVVTDETVKTHVSRILTKLGLRDRTQAVVAAYESGLVVPGGESQARPPNRH